MDNIKLLNRINYKINFPELQEDRKCSEKNFSYMRNSNTEGFTAKNLQFVQFYLM
jgi:hypothetical protein